MSWEVKTVAQLIKEGTVLHVQDGNHGSIHPKSSDYSDEGIYFIMANDFVNGNIDYKNAKKIPLELSEKLRIGFAKNDDVLLTHKGTIGNTAIVEGVNPYIMLTPQVTYYRLNKEKLLPKFLHAHFREPNFQERLHSISAQSTRPYIGITAQKNIKLTIPPLKTQKRIADILSAYDDLIENNLKRIKLLEQAAQNIYKEWFVNMRFPGNENTPINKESGLPVGWSNSELDSVATVQSSKRVFLADYVDNGVPFYRGKEISQKVKHEDVSEPYFISHEKFRAFDSGFGSPKENDILITAVGTIGNCYLVRKSDLPFYFKDGNLLWIHSYNEKVSGLYLIQYFQSPIFKGVLNSITIGSSQKALTISAVKKIKLTVPNIETLDKFDSIIEPIMKQIEVLAKTMTQLKAARDILLPRLMNRTIEV